MRRSRLVRFAGSIALMAALVVPSAALASTGNAASAATIAPATATVARIKLDCDLVLRNPLGPAKAVRANVCTWTAPEGVDVKTYRLWRVKDAPKPPARVLIAAIAAGQPLRYADRAIRAGHTYTYFVAGLGADGKRVALSNRVTIRVGRPVQALRLACTYSVERAGVGCIWSATSRPAASRYVLIRSVDGAARERIYSTWLRGKRSHFDPDVKPGQTVRYAVLAVAPSGRVVALGGPVVVTIPNAAAASR
jgi:hypothetical protein